jgi:hypothetical protein
VKGAAAVVLAAVALAGCGSDGGGDSDPAARDLLERGFATDVESGLLRMEVEIDLEGTEPVEGDFHLELEGPFRGTGGPPELPDLDMEFGVSGVGQDVAGRAIVTRENAWIEYEGDTYEVGEELWQRALRSLEAQRGEPETFADLGLDPLDWVDGLETGGEEQIGGITATRVTGRLDVGRVLRDLNKFETDPEDRIPDGTLDSFESAVGDVEFEAWIGDDGIWRRLESEAEFEVPEQDRDAVGGLESGRVSLEVELDDPNEPVDIEGPAEARDISELLRRLGIPPQLLLGPGFAVPTPG